MATQNVTLHDVQQRRGEGFEVEHDAGRRWLAERQVIGLERS